MAPESFGIFFKLKSGPFLFKIIAFIVAVIAFGLFKAYDTALINDSQLIVMSVGAVLAVDLVFFFVFMLPYLAYKKYLSTDSPLAEAWKYFISQRSKQFLSSRRYVAVSVTIEPTLKSGNDQRDLVVQFLQRWEAEGELLHSGKLGNVRPNKFRVSDFTIVGDVAIGEGMALLLRKIFVEIPVLLKTLGNEVVPQFKFGNEIDFRDGEIHHSGDHASPHQQSQNLRR
jgi:hypothetical protein